MMGKRAQTGSILLAVLVSCSVLLVVYMARAIASTKAPRSILQTSGLASLVVLSGCGFYVFVTTTMGFLAHAVVGVTLAGLAWFLFTACAARMSEVGQESVQQEEGRPPGGGDVAQRPDRFLATFYAVFGRRAFTVRFFAACLATSLLPPI